MLFVFAAFTLALAFWVYRVWRRRKWRQWLLNQPLSEADREIVLARVPLFARMPEDLRRSAEGKINLFLDQVDFYGCDGLEVTDEMMLPIAAQACMLVAGNDSWYSTLRTILLYPGAFKSQRAERDGYVITERETVRIGESWARGPVILSWADSVRGAFIDDDGHNVVFHEFAHQLDDLSGNTDGVPYLGDATRHAAWVEAFREAFERQNRLLEIGKRPFLDAYGATAPEELFAVAVEAFFEQPQALEREEHGLYRALQSYFRQDPARWG